MRDKLLILLNLLLILACAGFIWYLANAGYQEPPEIAESRKLLNQVEKNSQNKPKPKPPLNNKPGFTVTRPHESETRYASMATPIIKVDATPRGNYGILNSKNPFKPLYTTTPTPTPPPTPTPAPPDLNSAVASWVLQGLDEGKATFMDNRSQDVFDLTVGGPPKEAMAADNRPVQVKLISVDLEATKAVLGTTTDAQNATKSM